MKIERFEDIQAWQKSRELVKGVYLATSGTRAFKQDFSIKDQIRRAAISVMSNIAEGYARRSDKAFANFLYIAHASAAEVQSQLYIALDLKYIAPSDFDKTCDLCADISRQLQGLIKYLKQAKSLHPLILDPRFSISYPRLPFLL